MNKLDKKLSNMKWRSITLALILLATGYLLAVYSSDSIFARFGSLVVCIGVIFSFMGLSITLDNALEEMNGTLDRDHVKDIDKVSKSHPLQLTADGAVQSSADDHIKNISISHSKLKEHATKIYNHEKKILMKVEGGILIIGTLVWGFGDLFVIETSVYGMLCQTSVLPILCK